MRVFGFFIIRWARLQEIHQRMRRLHDEAIIKDIEIDALRKTIRRHEQDILQLQQHLAASPLTLNWKRGFEHEKTS
ncbi:MAG TPA: hypothetical protein DIW20_03630 [Rhodospirillaceae bacterium]|nr:hypothetical protein [Rhodospirillaceae bacterium]